MKCAPSLIMAILAPTFLLSCTAQTQGQQKAFEIKRGQTVNRLYAAYDPENPMQISWYLCRDEPADRNSPVRVNQVGALPLGTRIAQALNGQKPLDSSQPIEESNGTLAAGSLARVALSRIIRLSERLTIKDFKDPNVGKGCAPVVANSDATSVVANRDTLTKAFEQKIDVETTALMMGALVSCFGASKEAFLTSASFFQHAKGVDPALFRSFLGFQSNPLKFSNAGGIIWALVSSGTFCALSSRGLFGKVSEKFSLTDPNRSALWAFMDRVSERAEGLLLTSKWEQNLSVDEIEQISFLKDEIAAEENNLRLAQKQLLISSASSSVSVNASMMYASAYTPIFVSAWNALSWEQVTEQSSAQRKFTSSVVKGLDSILADISKVLSGAPPLPKK